MQPAKLGQRRTRQRDLIVEIVRDAQGPLTVPEILARAQESLPNLGVATVYRTVKLLHEAGDVQTVILPTGETRYEPVGRGHHHHFHCRVCDEVFDLEDCPVVFPKDQEVARGFRVESHELTFYGTCPSCS